ncbi:hypothetical protein ACFYY2_07320 [Streptomyces sp. NPDC001822]|uniref:hypothetical protein n=1 Tax=Streptomyces sp. NPDC001822 TaxID=3364614 RepID=UPI003691AD06
MADGPAVGEIGYDSATDRLGEVMEISHSGRYHLRPIGGGKEWEVAPDNIEELDDTTRLRARVSDLNRGVCR